MTMTTLARRVTGGVETHLDVHVAAALDEKGTLLGVESFETTRAGFKKLLAWFEDLGPIALVGMEGTSSHGAGLTRHLHAEGVAVVEVDRPNRQRRRRKGKSDPEDAISAARAAFSGDACGAAKTQAGNVEAIRVIRLARLSARRSRTLALNQMRSLISTAPDPVRDELRHLSVPRMLERTASYRPGTKSHVVSLTKWTLRTLARRAIDLENEIKTLDDILQPLVAETAPELVSALGIGLGGRPLGGRGRQPAPPALRGGLRSPVRHLADRRLERQARTASPQPDRRPSGQLSALAHRHHPDGL
jgi:transposase